MEFLILAASFPDPLRLLYVGLGLGLVIFIHELGHFAVAKWCGVKVERFSIGFGPVLLRFVRGETEYALSAIPFGGYVKMLGQDDADPSQMTDAKLFRDPRSYTSKTVLQRMAIISAGVINNIVTAVLFFVIAFAFGVEYQPAVVGQVVPGMPAWEAGLRMGDVLTQVGDRRDPQLRFFDVRQVVALSSATEAVRIAGLRNGKEFTVDVVPTVGEYFPTIGISGEMGLTLGDAENSKVPLTSPGSPAQKAIPPFQAGDEIVAIDGVNVASYADLQNRLARSRSAAVTFSVRRKGADSQNLPKISVGANRFRTLGLATDIGKIESIQQNSPAAKNGLLVGDKITHIITPQGERAIGTDLDPLQLPDFLASLHGQEIGIKVKRESPEPEASTPTIRLVPDDRPGWLERPIGLGDADQDLPLPVPALGVAFHILHHVVHVDPQGPAAGKIKPGDNIQQIEYVSPSGEVTEDSAKKKIFYNFEESKRNWPEAFWTLQVLRLRNVRLTVKSQGEAAERTVDIVPQEAADWYLPTRGLYLQPLSRIRRAAGLRDAISLGFRHTQSSIIEMWLTIRSLFSGRISPKSLGGPLQIGEVAYHFAKRGLPDLSLFLGVLSVSLAVMNFLPIPVLDGGHFAFLCWEAIRGKPASERVVIAANYIGLSMVLSLMCWVLSMDIHRWWQALTGSG